MKKIFTLLLTLFMLFTFTSFAAQPGDTITVPVSVGTSDAHVILLIFEYDENIFEFVSNECWGPNTQYTKYRMLMFDAINILPSGQIGTITLRIKEDAPLGIYTIPYSYEAVNTNYEFTTIGVSIGSIEVECPHSRTWENTVTETSYQIVCAECGEIVKTETIVEEKTFFENLITALINFFFNK